MQLTIKQAAELLRAPEAQIRRWIRDRGLPAVLFNEQYRLNRLDLLVWAQANQIPVPEPALTPNGDDGLALASALARGGIHRDLAGSAAGELLHALVQRLELPALVDRELLVEMLVAREAHGSTAIGHGIAIPHARFPIVAALEEPMLALGFARAPVEYAAPDGEPVSAVFLLLTPTIRNHLALLARLASALSAGLLAPVRARADDAAILAAARGGRA